LKVAKKLKLPISTDFRTNFHAYSQHYGVGWLKRPVTAYLKRFHNAADSTMVPTQQLYDELTSVGFQRVHVVPRGVDLARFDPGKRSLSLRNDWGCQSGDVVMLCVSRVAPEKNLNVLLKVYEALRASHPQLRLVMVGDGPLRASFEQAHPSVIFTGFLGEKELSEHYASADIFAFPSVTETFGNVSLEAMASGLPVVAFDDAAAKFLIQHEESGLLADCGNDLAFQQYVDRLAKDET
jgi:glycosyltransferase involved in cell wall biosynthesis